MSKADDCMMSIAIFDKVMRRFNDDDKDTIAQVIVDAALRYWINADKIHDFCIQEIYDDCIIFGSVNRVIWRPITGFTFDTSYCTTHFLAANGQLTGGNTPCPKCGQ